MSGSGHVLAAVAMTLGSIAMARAAAAQRTGNPILDSIPVFEVEAFRCKVGPDRRQTGIVVEGIDGLTTALHGVVGCGVILAHNDVSHIVWQNLHLTRVDVERDIAVLSSTDLQNDLRSRKIRGQRRAGHPLAFPQRLFVIGITRSASSASVFELNLDADRKTLRSFIVAGPSFTSLESRHSPEVDRRLITLTGPLQPGHSGAPVVDESGFVVAIGDGGSLLGEQLGWSIPIEDIQLVNETAAPTRLARLSSAQFDGLFATEESRVHAHALGAALRLAGAGGAGEAGGEVRVSKPWSMSRVRLQPDLFASASSHHLTQSLPTLPGLQPIIYTDRPTDGAVGAGISVYGGGLPTGFLDLYARVAAGRSTGQLPAYRTSASVGGEFHFRHGPPFFLEAGGKQIRLIDDQVSFNRYGDAERDKVSHTVRGFRALVGLRLDMAAWTMGGGDE